jgi:murein DD-endopeptidase MepM/ murein hydrolase activator NlpD
MVMTVNYQLKIDSLTERLETQTIRADINYDNYVILQDVLKHEVDKSEIRLRLINDKVNSLNKSLSRIYPGYDFRKKIDSALLDGNFTELPDDLFEIYNYNKKIKPHGIKKYKLVYPELCYPVDDDKGYVTYDYGMWHPYEGKHKGADIANKYNNSVFATADGVVWNVYRDKWQGLTLEYKVRITDKETGKDTWLFIRNFHLSSVKVEKGEHFKKGQIVGAFGNTGKGSHGSHLHIEAYELNKYTFKWNSINIFLNSTHGRWVGKL